MPETVHKKGDEKKGVSISRIPTTLGHIYFQTVWMNGQISSSMCFVPTIILENDSAERPIYE
ncbi:hypothetical protein ACTZL1_27505, partial [Klebsiella pneumoniae]|uniref:hypothetical protein n=1 Tax=Klebsiella pneumoniae TaxID=573 RepID=UPI003FD50381